MKSLIKKIPIVRDWLRKLDNLNDRTDWVSEQLSLLPTGSILLDAGCGNQQFRKYTDHLVYKAQDFGQYTIDDKKMMGAESGGLGSGDGYSYGELDYSGNIWEIKEEDGVFDAILCTEVFEHIPYPIETLKEFSRLLRPGGKLILTAPSNCLRHMDPYFFYTGFSDRWYERFLDETGFAANSIVPVGDYYRWMGVEIVRTARSHSYVAKLCLIPAFLYFFTKKRTQISIDTLCMGYHILATKNLPGSGK